MSTESDKKGEGRILLDAFYGFVNLVILTPVAISFTSIIFSHPIFAPYLPSLSKLVLFSSAVHQASFTSFSTLPFAVGQVQDAGLIFLSAMAYDMVEGMKKEGRDVEVIVSTVVVILSVGTFLLGLALIVVGKLKFAVAVQYIPVPVIGGYLAYIGFFCGRAGISMMTGLVADDYILITNMFKAEMLVLWFPGVFLGLLMYMLLRNINSPYVLPIFMVSTLVGFFGVLYYTGTSLEEAREMNYIAPLTESQPFWDSWKLYDFSVVRWGQLPTQLFRWVGMFIVVAFSSSLDVAAIEMELNSPLDYNQELTTVGVSNVVSGLLGGFTGSYIFSQTIFSMKRDIRSRVCGWVISSFELVLVMMPFSVTSYVPKLFFGSFLTLIAADLMWEWLIVVKEKVSAGEYVICWATFIAIHFTGVEGGLVLGTLLSMVAFTIVYAESTKVEPSFKSSTVVRTFKEQQMLNQSQGKVVTISLQGHIFFGSAVKLLEDVKRCVNFSEDQLKYVDTNSLSLGAKQGSFEDLRSGTPGKSKWNQLHLTPNLKNRRKGAYAGSADLLSNHEVKDYDSINQLKLEDSDANRVTGSGSGNGGQATGLHSPAKGSPSKVLMSDLFQRIQANLDFDSNQGLTTEFLILDFEQVFGVDATAIRSCFAMLAQIMRTSQVTLVFASLTEELEARLRQNGVITDHDIVIPLLDDALEWCEEQILDKQHMLGRRAMSPYSSPSKFKDGGKVTTQRPHSPSYYAAAVAKRRTSIELSSSSHGELASTSSADLMSYSVKLSEADQARHESRLEEVQALRNILMEYEGDEMYGRDEKLHHPDAAYPPHVLLKYFERREVEEDGIIFDIRQVANFFYVVEDGEVEMVRVTTSGNAGANRENEVTVERAHKVRNGGIFGELEFFMSTAHTVRALAVRRTVVWGISRSDFKLMEVENPLMCVKLQNLLIRNVAVSINHRVNDVVS